MALGLAALPVAGLAEGVTSWECRGDYDIKTHFSICCGDALSLMLTASPYPHDALYFAAGEAADPRQDSVWESLYHDDPDGFYPKLRWETKRGKGSLTAIDAQGAKPKVVAEGCRPTKGASAGQASTEGGIAP
ncbi:hypothetical protein [Stagnihabitans tardus]|uniref:Uncharacterized protein n=1 Tax=Stagnihabitans tardus TaxID=2699202 RepID=A0AAE4YDV2_9RHOB|nr:hypothetical protein [Stagnihabitans tardus]NBZ87825.1 hypothetical protein [Stagnihabitans tardus]